jgi:hypothetical protein
MARPRTHCIVNTCKKGTALPLKVAASGPTGKLSVTAYYFWDDPKGKRHSAKLHEGAYVASLSFRPAEAGLHTLVVLVADHNGGAPKSAAEVSCHRFAVEVTD